MKLSVVQILSRSLSQCSSIALENRHYSSRYLWPQPFRVIQKDENQSSNELGDQTDHTSWLNSASPAKEVRDLSASRAHVQTLEKLIEFYFFS